jgi:hypothetical protein
MPKPIAPRQGDAKMRYHVEQNLKDSDHKEWRIDELVKKPKEKTAAERKKQTVDSVGDLPPKRDVNVKVGKLS